MRDIVTEMCDERGFTRVTVNETETLYLTRAALRELPLTANEAFDMADYKHRLLLQQYPEALNRAVGLLAVRARSEGEIRRRLTDRRYLEETVDMVLCKLQKEGFLNDEAFARDWAEARANRQLGRRRIAMELRQKGVDGDTAERALNELDPDESLSQATALAVKLLRRRADGDAADTVRKTLAALARRGYEYDQAKQAVAQAIETLKNEL